MASDIPSAPKRLVSGEVKWETGGFYGGDLDSTEAAFVLRQSLLKIEVGAEHHVGTALDWTTIDPETEDDRRRRQVHAESVQHPAGVQILA